MTRPLSHVIFEATRACNLTCQYCYIPREAGEGHARHPPFSALKRTIARLLRTVDFRHITFTGGEPLLVDGLKELALTCRLKGKGITVISNGTVGTHDDYAMLARLGVSLFEFPLHAAEPDVHDSLTGVSGSHARVLESIRGVGSTDADLCVVVVLTKMNAALLPDTLELIRELGVTTVMLARFNIGGRGMDNIPRLVPSAEELRRAFATAESYAQTTDLSISSNVCVPHCLINPKDYPHIPIGSCGSDVTRRPITVDYDGNVRVCNHSPVVIGNLFTQSIDSMLCSDYVKGWNSIRPRYCDDCAHWAVCRGGCRAASEQMGMGLENEDPIIGITGPARPVKVSLPVT